MFPTAYQRDGEWWLTGLGKESFCSVVMDAQYAFNDEGRFFMVALIPSVEDRERLVVAVMNELGAPDEQDTRWTVGEVEVGVKVGGVAVTVVHQRLAPW